jgi:hypothetical protein
MLAAAAAPDLTRSKAALLAAPIRVTLFFGLISYPLYLLHQDIGHVKMAGGAAAPAVGAGSRSLVGLRRSRCRRATLLKPHRIASSLYTCSAKARPRTGKRLPANNFILDGVKLGLEPPTLGFDRAPQVLEHLRHIRHRLSFLFVRFLLIFIEEIPRDRGAGRSSRPGAPGRACR